MRKISFYKVVIIILCICIISGCRKEINHVVNNIYYAPNQTGSIAIIDNELLFLLNGDLYHFNENCKELELFGMSNSYEKTDELENCVSNIVHTTVIGSCNNILYAANYGNKGLSICQFSNNDNSFKNLKNIPVSSNTFIYPVFYNEYCYYISNLPCEGQSSAASLYRVSLNRIEDPELLCKFYDTDKPITLNRMHIYDNKVIMSGEMGVGHILYIYDIITKEILSIEGASIYKSAYNSGYLYYIENYKPKVIVYDIEKRKIDNSFSIKEYQEGMEIGCDDDYIYVSKIPMDNEVYNNGKYSAAMYVYDHKGNYINTISLEGLNSPEMGAYMCSTNQYIFCGQIQSLHIQSLYLIDKNELRYGQVKVYNLLFN